MSIICQEREKFLLGAFKISSKFKTKLTYDSEELLNYFNGARTVKEILDLLPYDKNAVWFLINKLVEIGCLAHASQS